MMDIDEEQEEIDLTLPSEPPEEDEEIYERLGVSDFPVMERYAFQKNRTYARARFSTYENSHLFLNNDELPTYRSSLKFPASREVYEYVEDAAQLQEQVKADVKTNNLYLQHKVTATTAKVMPTIFVVCLSCGGKLLMRYVVHREEEDQHQEKPRFKLVHFDNTHLHENEKKMVLRKETKNQIFVKEYQQHPDMLISDFYQHLKKEYNISDKELRYFLSLVTERRDQEMTSLLNFLERSQSKAWIVNNFSKEMLLDSPEFDRTKGYSKDAEFLMFALPFMVENYQNFGRICYINIIPGFVENKGKQGVRRWEIITFAGLSHFNNLAVYAVAFLDAAEHSTEAVTLVIRKFLKDFSKIPEIIITPYSVFFSDVITHLRALQKFQGLHLFDGICYLQTVGEQLECINDRIHYQEIILSKTKREFHSLCQALFQKVEPTKKNLEAFNRLVEVAPRMCFGEIETDQFLGLLFRFSANKYMFNLLRQIFTKGKVTRANKNAEKIVGNIVRKKWANTQPTLIKSVFLVARSVIRYNQRSTDYSKKAGYCQWRCENYLGLPEFENIRINIKKEYLDLILAEYGKIFEMEAAERQLKDPSRPEMKIFDVYDKRLKSIFTVAAHPEYSPTEELAKIIWRCNCLYSFKSGLPCAHEIKVAVTAETSIYDQIDAMWLKQREFPLFMKKRGRNKGTRRNTEK